MNKIQQYKELKQVISEKRKELKVRIERLNYNIFAGVSKNSTDPNLFNLLNPRTPLQMVSKPSNLKSTEEIHIRVRVRMYKLELKLDLEDKTIYL